MDVAGVTELVKEKWLVFGNSRYLRFKDFIKADTWGPMRGTELDRAIGVYTIFEGHTPIYVGSAGKGKHFLRERIADLFGFSPGSKRNKLYHTLTRKLVKKHEKNGFSLELALKTTREFYLENCSFRVVKTATIDQARMLEQVFVLLLNHPKYNA